MVIVKVRETYDLHTVKNKMSVIGVHTPGSKILKRNYPGLLMQCKAWRPVSCDVRLACASMMPLDPQGVGLENGDVAPEDLFNPILYKTVSNVSMSQIEAYINRTNTPGTWEAQGDSLDANYNGLTSDDFGIYYGLLANTHDWKHANPQAGLEMRDVYPLVYENLNTIGQVGVLTNSTMTEQGAVSDIAYGINPDGSRSSMLSYTFRGNAKRMPFINTTTFIPSVADNTVIDGAVPGFNSSSYDIPTNRQVGVPSPKVYCALLCIPPSRLHQLFYRMVVEWRIEFSGIRPLSEITSFGGLEAVGNAQHVMSYSYVDSKLLTSETDLVDTSAETGITKVM